MRLLILAFSLCLTLAAVPALAAMNEKEAETEAKTYQAECKADPLYSKKFDCECLAAELYSARLKGYQSDRTNILLNATPRCVNIEEVAGMTYTKCQAMTNGTPAARETYCRCYANTYAKMFAAAPTDHPYAYQKQMSAAKGVCLKLKPKT